MSLNPDISSEPVTTDTPPEPGQTAQPIERRFGPTKFRTAAILTIILLIAAFFRLYGRDFDQGHNQHPDERYIVGKTIALRWPDSWTAFLNVDSSPINLRAVDASHPQGDHYPYGSFPVYLVKASGWLLDTLVPPSDTRPRGYFLNDYNGVTQLGRTLAALFDLVTVFLVFLIGRRLYSRNAGLIAAALVAFAVTEIQIAHFYASDVFLVTFMMGAMYFSVLLMQRPSWYAAAGAGACIGLAVASKVSVVPFALIVVAAVALRAAYRKRTRKLGAEFDDPVGVRPASERERALSFMGHFGRGLGYVALAAVLSLLFFSISEPYVLLLPALNYVAANGIGSVFTGLSQAKDAFFAGPFWGGIQEQAGIQSGQADLPYTRQYIGTTPLVYQIQNMVMWGLSPIPGLVTLVGFVVGLWNALRRRPAEILLMSGAIPYFATILTLEAKWMRYMLPLVPIFCILGAAMLLRGMAWMRVRLDRRPWLKYSRRPLARVQRNAFQIIAGVAVGCAFLWAVAFMNIYSQEHSRVQASRWIYDNVPATISDNGQERPVHTSGEIWDDFVPLPVAGTATQAGHDNGAYQPNAVSYGIYDDRPPDDEFNYLKGLLQQTDYLVLASNRLYGSVRHEPWRYPVQIQFYNLLFQGKLGFKLVHTSMVTPQLFGINFNDQSADESFTVYDHPRVDVFQKTSNLTDEQLHILFSDALNRPADLYSTQREKPANFPDDNSLQYDTPVSELGDVSGAWNPLFQTDTQWTGLILWLLLAELLGLIALPILFLTCRRLPDRGYPIAKILGLVLLSWGIYVASSAHLIPFTFWGLVVVLAMLLGLSFLCWRLGGGALIAEFWAHNRKLIFYYEILFLAAFGFMVFIKMLYPDLWGPIYGGERPMEFGFLNSVLRSPWMPAADPFFAGGVINYYYYGQFMMAAMMKLLGADSGVAVSLAMALLFALTFTAGASIAYNIVAWARSRRSAGELKEVSNVGMVFGAIAGFLMLFIGNLHGAYQLVEISNPSLGQKLLELARTWGFTEQAVVLPVSSFDFWGPSRIIAHTINEFPYWSFLYGDFHPHLIDMAFTMGAVVLAMNLAFAGPFRAVTRPGDPRGGVGAALAWLWGAGWAGALNFGVLAVLLGTLFATNSWDFPTYAGIAAAGVLVALLLAHVRQPGMPPDTEAEPAERVTWNRRVVLWASAVISTGLLGIVGLMSALPFLLSFKNVLNLSIRPLVDGGPLQDAPGTIMHRTTLAEYLMMWAIFIFITLSYLVVRLWAFPWRDSVRDLAALFAGSRRVRTATTPGVLSPGAAFALLPERRQLSPALAAAGGGSEPAIYAFASDTRDVRDPELEQEGHTNAAVADVPGADSLAAAGTAAVPEDGVPADTAPEQDGSDGALAGPAISEQTEPIDYNLDAQSSWIAAAHQENLVQSAAAARRVQPGVIPLWAGLSLLGLTALATALQVATGQLLLALLVALIGGIAATTLATSRSAASLFTGVVVIAALAVSMGVELVYLADHLRGGDLYRMNTVFKFYIQVWLLFGAGCAAAIYYIIFGVHETRDVAVMVPEQEAAAQRPAWTAEDNVTPDAPEATLPAPDAALVDGPLAADGTDHSPAGNGHLAASADTSANPPITEALDNWLVWSELAAVAPIAEPEPEPAVEPFWLAEEGLSSDRPLVADKPVEPISDPSGLENGPSPVEVPAPTPVNVEQPAVRSTRRWSGLRLAVTSAWAVAFALLLVASLVYTFLGTPVRVAQRFPVNPPFGTLDGRAYLQYGTYGPVNAQGGDGANGQPLMINLKYDYEGIQWLNQNVSGLHVIFEGPYEYYRDDGMRVASNTGLPMIVGGLHQDEQRYGWQVSNRSGESNELLTTPDPQIALTLISKYHVDYIYLGQLEQARAGGGMAKFEQLAQTGLIKKVCCSTPPEGIFGTIIYQVVWNDKLSPEKVLGAPVQGAGVPGISFTPLPTPSPTAAPTPPTDDPTLKALINDANADPTNIDKRQKLVDWYRDHQYFVDAARELETMVKQRPQDIAIRHMLGDAYQSAGQPDKALKAWKDAVDVDPNNPAAHNKLGTGYLDRHQYDLAIIEFQAAVQKDPNFNEADFHLGEAYDAKGQHDNAVKAYQQAIDAWKNAPADRKQGMEGWATEAQKRIGK